MEKPRIIKFQTFGDLEKGFLTIAFDGVRTGFEFEVKRAYYIHNVPWGAIRGGHAHKKTDQVFICLAGGCEFSLNDEGGRDFIATTCVKLGPDGTGLLVPHLVWHCMYDFLPGTVLIAFASTEHDEKDYIRDQDEFFKYLKNLKEKVGEKA